MKWIGEKISDISCAFGQVECKLNLELWGENGNCQWKRSEVNIMWLNYWLGDSKIWLNGLKMKWWLRQYINVKAIVKQEIVTWKIKNVKKLS